MDRIDTLLHAKWIIPVEPAGVVLEQHSLAIHEGRILQCLPQQQARSRYQAEAEFELSSHALIPGMINAHTHAAMSLFRGLADDLPLMDWLQNHIWPAEARWVNQEFVHDGTQLAVAEMIRSGTTCFNDMYFFPDETARVAESAKIRASVGLILIDFPTVWAADAEEYLHKGLEVQDRYRHNPLISTLFAPHAPYTVSDEALSKVVTLAEELDIGIHMHVHETAFEIQQSQQEKGLRPLQRLKQLGIVSPRLLGVHMTQLEAGEIEILQQSNASVAHCPESNLKLASGFCPLQRLMEQGVNVALGTDGAASNNDLDMLGEMRTAALLAKAVAEDASAVPAEQILRMATINGAKALGLEEHIGSLETGKAADVVAIDLDDLATLPVYNPVSQIVYACTRQQVSHVWVAGQQLLHQGVLTTIDETSVKAKARQWAQKIYESDQHPQSSE